MKYNNRLDVQKRVQEHYDWAVGAGYEVVGVFLQGSWNYGEGLSDEESDVDTKCLVLPTFEDFCLGKKMVSTTHVMPNDEHCDVKDLRLYMGCFKKQNVNFVEILFTEFYVLNPKYEKLFEPMFEHREEVAHYDEKAALNCMVGMAYEKEKALEHPYPATKDKIEKYGFDGKQLSHLVRLSELMNKYVKGVPYELCLKTSMPEYLLNLKRNKLYNLNEARQLCKTHLEVMKEVRDEYLAKNLVEVNTKVDKLMNKVVVNCMKENFISYLKDSCYE